MTIFKPRKNLVKILSIYISLTVIGHPNRDEEEDIFQYIESRDERGEQEGKCVMETKERTPEYE